MKTNYFGIDLGGTKIKSVLLNEHHEVIEQDEILTEDSSTQPELWKEKIIDLIKTKSKELDPQNKGFVQFGISAPGLTDKKNTQILHMPGRLAGLEKFNWSRELNKNIYVVNDGHSACLAEYQSFYKDKNIRNLLLLTLGTGVGGGAILDGKLFQGAIQRAGHFGHITLDHMGSPIATNMVGSLEYALGNFSISERTHGTYNSVKELVIAHKKGDELASFWWLSSVQKLATALASLCNAFSPEMIVLGGGIATGSGPDLMSPLKKFMSLYEWRPGGHQVKIELAKHNKFAGAIGAALFAKSKSNKL